MVPALAIGGGTLTLLVFVVLAVFVLVGWFSLRRNVRGIDFSDTPDETHASASSPSDRA